MRVVIPFALLLLLFACRPPDPLPPSTPPVPPRTPPPLPQREINAAHVSGRVTDVTGLVVDGPRISAWVAGRDCVPAGNPLVVTGGPSGEFSLTLERGTGPEHFGCAVIEASAGGSTARVERLVLFSAAKNDARTQIEVTIALPRAPELTREESERLIRLLATAITTDDRDAVAELDLYIRGDVRHVDIALDAYRQYLRTVNAIEFADAEGTHWMRWRLTGVAGRDVPTSVYRDNLIALHGPLIDYAGRAAEFLRRVLDVAHQGDLERMVRVLTADDEDVPVETARRVIEHFRARYDLPRASIALAGVDDLGNVLRYRVSGNSREGELNQEIVEVGYGDGLVWLRGF